MELTPESLKWIWVERNNDYTISVQVRDAIKSSLEAVGLADITVVIRLDVLRHNDIGVDTFEDELRGYRETSKHLIALFTTKILFDIMISTL